MRESIKRDDVMAKIPKEHKELVEAIKTAAKYGFVCADETGVTVLHTAISLTPMLKEDFENNPELKALGMKFVKADKKAGCWVLDF